MEKYWLEVTVQVGHWLMQSKRQRFGLVWFSSEARLSSRAHKVDSVAEHLKPFQWKGKSSMNTVGLSVVVRRLCR